MNSHKQVDQNSHDPHAAGETGTSISIEAIIAMVSHLESEIRPRNPIAAYFLERCRCALLQNSLNNLDCNVKHKLAQ